MKNIMKKTTMVMVALSLILTSMVVVSKKTEAANAPAKLEGSWYGEYLTKWKVYEKNLIIENQGDGGHIETLAQLSFGRQMYVDVIASLYNFRKVNNNIYKASLQNTKGKKIKGATLTITYINKKKIKIKVNKKIGGISPKMINGIYTK